MLKRALTTALFLGAAVAAQADGDIAKGEKVFKKCAACHAVGDGAKNKIGPVLNGIIGRPAASLADFKYSDAMKAKGAEGLVWTDEVLHEYLKKPSAMVKGTTMSFAGLRKDAERDDVIAYLAQFN